MLRTNSESRCTAESWLLRVLKQISLQLGSQEERNVHSTLLGWNWISQIFFVSFLQLSPSSLFPSFSNLFLYGFLFFFLRESLSYFHSLTQNHAFKPLTFLLFFYAVCQFTQATSFLITLNRLILTKIWNNITWRQKIFQKKIWKHRKEQVNLMVNYLWKYSR